MSTRSVIRSLLSVFIVVHLVVVAIAPNRDTYLGKKFEWLVQPYGMTLGLLNNWGFFAPEPGPPPVYVEWDLLDVKGDVLGQGRWPEITNGWLPNEAIYRRIAAGYFMLAVEGRPEKMLTPYLCAKNPDTHSIRFWKAQHTIPGVDDLTSGKRRLDDGVGLDRRSLALAFCGERS